MDFVTIPGSTARLLGFQVSYSLTFCDFCLLILRLVFSSDRDRPENQETHLTLNEKDKRTDGLWSEWLRHTGATEHY